MQAAALGFGIPEQLGEKATGHQTVEVNLVLNADRISFYIRETRCHLTLEPSLYKQPGRRINLRSTPFAWVELDQNILYKASPVKVSLDLMCGEVREKNP